MFFFFQYKNFYIGFGNNFLGTAPNAQAIKEKIDKLDFTKMKNFGISKGAIKRMKRQPKEWEKVFQIIYLIRD